MWKSYLWQNFLIDQNSIENIIRSINYIINEKNIENIIEIWPWKWAITKYLDFSKKIFLIEKDNSFKEILEKIINKKWTWRLIFCDILEFDINYFLKTEWFNVNKTLIIWNLPYYISSAILNKFFIDNSFLYWIFMVQKEFGEKISTNYNKKTYLRWLLNYSYEIWILDFYSKQFFNPIPKVDSVLIKLIFSWKKELDFNKMKTFIEQVNKYKRKTLLKIWKIKWWIISKSNILFQNNWEIYKLTNDLFNKRLEDLDRMQIKKIIWD